MFDKSTRKLTAGIDAEIPSELQLFLWNMIDEARDKTRLDYLQVFDINPDFFAKHLLHVKHSQEVPKFEQERTIITNSEPITAKIYVIDDGDHSTMLFSREY